MEWRSRSQLAPLYQELPLKEYDYIIIGSGIAGLYTALLAQEHGSVLLITKGEIDDCNTRYAQGGIAAPIGADDSPQLHTQDTLVAGDGLCDEEAVGILTQEAPDRITDLILLGVPFDTTDGEIALAKEGAHSVARVLHAGGDATGSHIELTLVDQVHQSKVEVLEHTLATRIAVQGGVAVGLEALDTGRGTISEYSGRFIVLATGGAGRLFSYTTNPDVATGDGVALAFRAGAQVMDMEFFQFHPTALRLPGSPPFLISEAVRGEGGVLRNAEGKGFMGEYDPRGDLASRDVVARAILSEMQRSGTDHVLLDVTHLAPQHVVSRFPSIYRFCLEKGLDITISPIPVAPAAHYMMGGVKADTWGQTSLEGLYACGEAACVGVHGANRLASNSLLDTLVFGRRVVEHSLGRATEQGAGNGTIETEDNVVPIPKRDLTCASVPPLTLESLQSLMWEKVGMVRNGAHLLGAVRILNAWSRLSPSQADRTSFELSNLVQVGLLMAEAALARQESRGAHFRIDFPEPVTEWHKHIIYYQGP